MLRSPWMKWPAGFAAALFALGAAGAVTSAAAAARPPGDPHQYSDRTAEFVPLGHPDAQAAAETGKKLVLSPYGARRSIVCRGDGASIPLYDCAQEDGLGLGWAPLHRTDTLVGEVWIYFP
ncbi:hypothetical protein [Nocardia sp. NPDC003345]